MNMFTRIGAFTVGLVAVVTIAYGVWSAMASAQLEERLGALRKAGRPITLADLKKEAPTQDDNAAVWLRRGRTDLDAISKEIFGKIDFDHSLSAEDIHHMRTVLTRYPTGLDCAHKAAQCAVYHPEADYAAKPPAFIEEQLNRVTLFRSATRALQCECMVQLNSGDTKGSLQSALDIVALSKHLEEEPSIIAYLTRLALVGIAATRLHDLLIAPLDADDHKRIDEALASLDNNKGFRRAIETERAFAIDSINALHEQERSFGLSPLMKIQICSMIDLWNVAEESADMSYVDADRRFTQNPPHGALARLSAPAMQAALAAHARVIAEVRTLRILNAIKSENITDIKELKIDDSLWIDPINGKRLTVLQEGGMWTVYSVGRNGRDDGGDVDSKKDADTGWKMPLSAQN